MSTGHRSLHRRLRDSNGSAPKGLVPTAPEVHPGPSAFVAFGGHCRVSDNVGLFYFRFLLSRMSARCSYDPVRVRAAAGSGTGVAGCAGAESIVHFSFQPPSAAESSTAARPGPVLRSLELGQAEPTTANVSGSRDSPVQRRSSVVEHPEGSKQDTFLWKTLTSSS
jgi:hypothetical protein